MDKLSSEKEGVLQSKDRWKMVKSHRRRDSQKQFFFSRRQRAVRKAGKGRRCGDAAKAPRAAEA